MLICSIDGCGKKVNAMGFCSMHYMRLRRSNLVPVGTRARGSLEERFWRFVSKSDNCWAWIGGSRNSKGYGQIQTGGKGTKHVLAHRLSYTIHKGEIPQGYVVMHSCDNPSCVNPDHLVAGTQSENILDSIKKCRKVAIPPVFKGESHHMAKLTEAQAKYIKTCGRKTADIANEFGIGITTVNRIKSGRSWSHI